MEKYSYSKITKFFDCPFSYFQRYVNSRPEEGHGTSQFGSLVHYILEMYSKGEIAREDMAKFYIQNYGNYVQDTLTLKLSETFEKNMENYYYDDGLNYLLHFKGFPAEWVKILDVEYDFTENIEDRFLFTGKIDLVVEDKDGNIIICDHKSKNGFKKDELAKYGRQLYLYAYAVKQKYGKYPTKLVFNVFRKGIYEEIEFDIDEYNRVMKWAKDCVEEIENTFDFSPIPWKDRGRDKWFWCWNFCGYRNDGLPECIEALSDTGE